MSRVRAPSLTPLLLNQLITENPYLPGYSVEMEILYVLGVFTFALLWGWSFTHFIDR